MQKSVTSLRLCIKLSSHSLKNSELNPFKKTLFSNKISSVLFILHGKDCGEKTMYIYSSFLKLLSALQKVLTLSYLFLCLCEATQLL